MSVTHISQTGTYNAVDVNAVIAQLLALDGSTTMTGTLLQSPLNVLRKAGQTGQEEIWYEYAGDPAYIQIVRNAYYSGGWKAKYPWDDGVNYLHPCRIIIGNYGKLYFEHAVGLSGGVNSAITWETGDINGRQFLSDAASGTPPFVVASATQVPNLNADMVDGMHASEGAEVTAYPTTDQVIESGSSGEIVAWTAQKDTGGNFASDFFTAPTNGFYFVNVNIRWMGGGSASGFRRIELRGGESPTWNLIYYADTKIAVNTHSFCQSLNIMVYLDAGSKLCVFLSQSSGGDQPIRGTLTRYSNLSIFRVSR